MRIPVVCFFLLYGARIGFCGETPERDILAIQQRIASKDLDGASKALDLALRDDPRNGGLLNLRGIIHAQRREYELAEKDFSGAIRLSPHVTGAYLNLARILLLRGAGDSSAARSAIDLYRRVLRVDPSNVEARSQLALLLERQSDFAGALAELSKLPPSEQARAPVRAMLCLALAAVGRVEEARQSASELLSAKDLSESDILEITGGLFRAKKADLVRELMEGLVKRGLASVEGVEQLVRAYDELHPGGARGALEQLAQEYPASSVPLVALARVAYRGHDLRGALGYLAHARDLTPNDASIHFFFGIVSVDLDLAVEARRSLERAVQLDPANVFYHYALGGVELQMGAAEEAAARFRTFADARPDDPRGHFALGAAEFAAGKGEESRAQMRIAARSKETAAGAEYYLGRLDRLDGDRTAAKAHFERSVQENPRFAEPRAELGRIALEQGDFDSARRELQAALSINPDSSQANTFLLALYQRVKDPNIEAQRRRVDELQKKKSEKQDLMLRAIRVQPY
jgi:tetratricopeptide (TPR) repeat protein